ncbi:signal peptide-containing protein [Gluconobacter oxydans]|uniref:lipase family protein n=1 Tax=Gluconobacter thailandicus TaxID=257438 RepID=UPI000318BF5E|nr:lipase family protein [Gluconobacter thailandicus]ANQ40311.1 signal peptide-containing protein [Gluconobacter oxydans]
MRASLSCRTLGFVLSGLCFVAASSTAEAATTDKARKAGTLVSSAPLADALSLPDAGKSLRITYLSTDGVTGKGLVPVTAEVIVPAGEAPAGGWPIVAWAHGTVGNDDSCAPSLNPYSARNTHYLSEWMKRGFAIVATDYQGLGTPGVHPYLNTRAEAYSVLDSVRAALKSVPGLQNKIMIVGQSQGGGAAFASAAFAPAYAPDLNIRGTVATGIPYLTPEILSGMLAEAGKAKGYSPLVAYTLLIGSSYSGLNPHFRPEEAFTAKAMPAFKAAETSCLTGLSDLAEKDGLTLANALQPTYAKAMSPAMKGMMYPTLKLAQPLFVGTGTADEDVPTQLQVGLVKAACAAGTVVQAHLYKGLDHSQTVNASLPDSAAFTKAVMAGEPVTPQCTPIPQ